MQKPAVVLTSGSRRQASPCCSRQKPSDRQAFHRGPCRTRRCRFLSRRLHLPTVQRQHRIEQFPRQRCSSSRGTHKSVCLLRGECQKVWLSAMRHKDRLTVMGHLVPALMLKLTQGYFFYVTHYEHILNASNCFVILETNRAAWNKHQSRDARDVISPSVIWEASPFVGAL